MTSSPESEVRAFSARCLKDALVVHLTDGRVLQIPLLWFPRLDAATARERAELRLIGDGEGIHWPAIDEDLDVASLLLSEAAIRRGYRPPAARRPHAGTRTRTRRSGSGR